MDDEERQYWFDIMPSMSDAQAKRLFDILDNERKKLEELEMKYQGEIKTLNDKYLNEWQEFQIKDTLKKLNKEEKNTLLVFVENPNPNKNIMPFTLAFSNDFENIEKILVKDRFNRFDIRESEKYIDSMLFNHFVAFITAKNNFKKYYNMYGID
ncbi:MAG: hypothetical protein OEL19_09485, partial [Sulfurimonas sp.]|nr:hypothetical protein [Sulfurimonas sp.]